MSRAVREKRTFSRDGVLEAIFASAFKGLVYPQIWEDPNIDMEALAITPECHVMAIASGGCNILSYLLANPQQITAVDLSKAHVALTRLKLAAAANLPSWRAFYQFFGEGGDETNVTSYRRFLVPRLDLDTRGYWEQRSAFGIGSPRIAMFSKNFYHHGLLGRFIGVGHAVARAYGVNFKDLMRARSIEEQRGFFDAVLAPLFDKRLVRWATSRRLSLYGLGIPPAQYKLLAAGGDMAGVLRERVERLTCGFSLNENYFAWQAFSRSYAGLSSEQLPPYLQPENFDTIRARVDRVAALKRSFTDHLEGCADHSLDRFVLLDAQDWMTDAQLNALWQQITRTARPGARVIFRTAAVPSLLPGRLAPALLNRWRYEADLSRDWTKRDRSAIYGGFHLYVLRDGE